MGGGALTLLLDTHVLLWWLQDGDRLSPEQVDALERAEARGNMLGLAAISLWELAMLADRGRIELLCSVDVFLDELESHPALTILPLTSRIALESTRLGPSFHQDPADRLIAATARVHGLRLVTSDRRIRASGVIGVL